MCGIAGWNLTEKPKESFVLALALIMQERGEDSYGFFDGTTITKDAEAIGQGIPARMMCVEKGFLHTRHATSGRVIAENAHPFAIGDIVGAHNGMIYNHFELQKDHARFASAPVDSMHIFCHIAENKPLTDLEGYGAIEYYQNGEWLIGAACGGALEVAKLDVGVVWASTKQAIQAAVYQAGYTLQHFYTIEDGKIYRVESDSLYVTDRLFDIRSKAFAQDKALTAGGWHTIGRGDTFDYLTSEKGNYDTRTEWEKELDARERKSVGRYSECASCGEWEVVEDLSAEGLCFACLEESVEDGASLSANCEWCGEFKPVKEVYECLICESCKRIVA